MIIVQAKEEIKVKINSKRESFIPTEGAENGELMRRIIIL